MGFNPCFHRLSCNFIAKGVDWSIRWISFNPCFHRLSCNERVLRPHRLQDGVSILVFIDSLATWRLASIFGLASKVSILVFVDSLATQKPALKAKKRKEVVSILVFVDSPATMNIKLIQIDGKLRFNPCFRRLSCN